MSGPRNRVYRVLLWHRDEIIEIHTLTVERDGAPSRYRALTSMQCFSSRELEARYGEKPTPKAKLPPFHCGLFEQQALYEHMENTRRKRCIERGEEYEDYYAEFPVFHHESLWDFYKAIGYDYKSKKWTREEPK